MQNGCKIGAKWVQFAPNFLAYRYTCGLPTCLHLCNKINNAKSKIGTKCTRLHPFCTYFAPLFCTCANSTVTYRESGVYRHLITRSEAEGIKWHKYRGGAEVFMGGKPPFEVCNLITPRRLCDPLRAEKQ